MLFCVPQKKKFRRVKRKTFMSRANKMEIEPSESFEFAFIKSSRISGFEYIKKGVPRATRCFWLALISILLLFSSLIAYRLAETYFANATHFARANPNYVSNIRFPSVVLCSHEPLLDPYIEKFMENRLLPENRTSDQISKSVKTLFVYFKEKPMIEPETEDVHILNEYFTLNNLTISEVVEGTSMHCEDILKRFKFLNRIHECNQDDCPGWKREITVFGICCAFNYLPSKSEDAYVLDQFGKHSGLNILLSASNETIGKLFLILTASGNYVTYGSRLQLLETYSENFLQLTAKQFEPAMQYETLPLASRRCYSPRGEPRGDAGWQSKCALKCLMKAYHKLCGCHPFTIPTVDENILMVRNCSAIDIMCVWNNIAFRNPKCVDCIELCRSLQIRIDNSFIDFDPKRQFGINELYNDTEKIEHPLLVHIFYASQLVTTYQRVPRMNWIDFISNLGGMLSLALGISLMNLIEIFYFFGYKMVKAIIFSFGRS